MAIIPGGGGGAAPPPPTDPWSLPYYEEPAPWDVPAPPPAPPPAPYPGAPPYGYTEENQPVPPGWGSSSDRGRARPAAPPPPPPLAGWAAQRYGTRDPYAENYYGQEGAGRPWMRQGQRIPWVPTLAQAEEFYGQAPSPYPPGYGPPRVQDTLAAAPPAGFVGWETPRGKVWLPPGQDPGGVFTPPGQAAGAQGLPGQGEQPWGPGDGGGGGGGGGDGSEGGAETPEVEGLGEYRPVYAPFSDEGGTVAVLQPDDYMSLPEFVRPYLGQILERLGWKAELIGQWGPFRFTRTDAWRMWITMADLGWITDFRARQWLMAFFGAKGWGEAQPWPPEILDEPPTH